jgi:hypothetical protein
VFGSRYQNDITTHAIVNEENFAWKKRKKKKQGANTFVYVSFFQVLVVVI